MTFYLRSPMPSALASFLLLAISGASLHAARVEMEGEAFAEGTFQSTSSQAKIRAFASGERWAQSRGTKPNRAVYSFEISEAGNYQLWVRQSASHAPLEWRVDGGEWERVVRYPGLTDGPLVEFGATSAHWLEWGAMHLAEGSHRLEIRTANDIGKSQNLEVDVVVFTTETLNPQAEDARIVRDNDAYTKVAGVVPEGWYVVPPYVDTFNPSILSDYQVLNRPAGAHGALQVKGDKLFFGDGTEARFWGISGPASPEKGYAEYFTKRARRLGVNLVRLHTLDAELVDFSGDVTWFDPKLVDRFDYLIHCCQQEGISVLIDALYDWYDGKLKPGDGFPDGDQFSSRNRIPWFYDARLQDRNKRVLAHLLDRVNPYTGIRNGENPAVVMLCVVNENSLFFYSADNLPPAYRDMRMSRWNAWLKQKYAGTAQLEQAWGSALTEGEHLEGKGTVKTSSIHDLVRAGRGQANPGQLVRASDYARFLEQVQTAFFQGVRRYVQEELRLPILVYGSAWHGSGWTDRLEQFSNAQMDLSSRHGYFDHTQGGFGVTAPQANLWMLQDLAAEGRDLGQANLPTERFESLIHLFSKSRIGSLPFGTCEWNIYPPNDFIMDGVMVMSTYAAMQGWSFLMQYRVDQFDLPLGGGYSYVRKSCAPSVVYQYPFAHMAYVRGDIREAGVIFRRVIPTERLFDPGWELPELPPVTALVGRVETVFGQAEEIRGDIEPFVDRDAGVISSSTGEFRYRRANPYLVVDAPRLKGWLGNIDRETVSLGQGITFEGRSDYAALWLGSVPKTPLDQSPRIWIGAFGHVRGVGEQPRVPSNTKGKNGEKLVELKSPGTPPALMRQVAATIRFENPVTSVFALDGSGLRVKEVPLLENGHAFRIEDAPGCFWFEAVRKKPAAGR